MDLSKIILPEHVFIGLSAPTKWRALQLVSQKAAICLGVEEKAILHALEAREQLGTTGIGNGIAVPHGKYAPLKGVMAVFMKLTNPVDFESVDDQPVDMVMMLLAPMGAGADHLKALARVARVLRSDSVADALRHSNDPSRLHAILTQPVETTKAA